jgi:hypothetical protein
VIEGLAALAMAALVMLGLLFAKFGRKGSGISLLVPFHSPVGRGQRAENWRWLEKYWRCRLPGAEIVMGEDWKAALHDGVPFSKSAAVNNAARKASGDVFVIVDADGYIDTESVLRAAKNIRKARKCGHRLWYVPYRWFFRLTRECSRRILDSDPCNPHRLPTPPYHHCIQSTDGSQHGHWYGAMIQIMPREAFEEVGGWDERFRGWGGEDAAAMRAMDTIYGKHKTLPVQVLHLWHPMSSPLGENSEWVSWQDRIWAGQKESGVNKELSGRYYAAYGDMRRMRDLVEEGRRHKKERESKG